MPKSNIEKWMGKADAHDLHTARVAGAAASHKVRSAKKQLNTKLDMLFREGEIPELIGGLLMDELTQEQRSAVRKLVPETIEDDEISPLIAMVFSVVDKTIRSGDAAALERILRMAGETAELRVKLDVQEQQMADIDYSQMSDEELLHILWKCQQEEALDMQPVG